MAPETRWVGTWMAAPQRTEPANLPPPPGLAGNGLRQFLRVSLGGNRLQVRLSNEFGDAPMVLSSARIALAASIGVVRPETERTLNFGGAPGVTIPTGCPIVSDPLDFALPPRADVAITLQIAACGREITGHPGSRTTSYLLPSGVPVDHWYLLNGVAVTASRRAGAVAILGDSLTDGRNSPTNGNGRWPDHLARRLQADRRTREVSVLNAGIGGNRVRHDGLGPSGLSRLDRDVLAQPGVRWLIVFEGINDLGTGASTADDLIAAYRQIAARARTNGVRVYGATLLPCGGSFYFSPALEASRQRVNDWVRSAGVFDAVLDFDATARDAERPTQLGQAFDSDDHLHPNAHGYELLAESIDLSRFIG